LFPFVIPAQKGLKSVVIEIPVASNVVGNLCKRLTPKLVSSIKTVGLSYLLDQKESPSQFSFLLAGVHFL